MSTLGRIPEITRAPRSRCAIGNEFLEDAYYQVPPPPHSFQEALLQVPRRVSSSSGWLARKRASSISMAPAKTKDAKEASRVRIPWRCPR